MGKLEDTIRQLHKKYKNVPSPLSEEYIRRNQNVNFVSQEPNVPKDIRSNLLGNYRPLNDTFR